MAPLNHLFSIVAPYKNIESLVDNAIGHYANATDALEAGPTWQEMLACGYSWLDITQYRRAVIEYYDSGLITSTISMPLVITTPTSTHNDDSSVTPSVLTPPSTQRLLDIPHLKPTTPLSRLADWPANCSSKTLLEFALHYKTHTIAKYVGKSCEHTKAKAKLAYALQTKRTGLSRTRVKQLHYEYVSRHGKFCKDPARVRCCTAEGGVRVVRQGKVVRRGGRGG